MKQNIFWIILEIYCCNQLLIKVQITDKYALKKYKLIKNINTYAFYTRKGKTTENAKKLWRILRKIMSLN
jgi:hypothetical protein